jgi:hypothetical protein
MKSIKSNVIAWLIPLLTFTLAGCAGNNLGQLKPGRVGQRFSAHTEQIGAETVNPGALYPEGHK